MQNYLMRILTVCFFMLFPTILIGKSKSKKNVTMFVSWGWNRSSYTQSNIHFIGNDYDFTLKNTVAKDRQSPFNLNIYFNPKYLSIPQYNFSVGGIIDSQWSFTIGQDHMKYVVQQNSPAIINGTISNQTSYTGVYQNNPRLITSDFLIYEHTNGLNYLHITLNNERKLFGNKKQAIRLQSVVGLNAGLLVPKSDVKLMSYSENDQWHLAGYGFGINAGIKVNFWKHIFFRCTNSRYKV
jgi:hypothetical protein